jgi:hypothetical protein
MGKALNNYNPSNIVQTLPIDLWEIIESMLDAASQYSCLFVCKELSKKLTSLHRGRHLNTVSWKNKRRHLRCVALISSAIGLSINQLCWLRSVPVFRRNQEFEKGDVVESCIRCSCCSGDYVENLATDQNLTTIETVRALVASNSPVDVLRSKLNIYSKKIDLQTFTIATIYGNTETLSLFRNSRYGASTSHIEYAQKYASCRNSKNWFRIRLL